MAIVKYSRPCSRNTPGNSKVFVIEAANVTGVTVTSGEVSAVTMSGATKFLQLGADMDTIQATSEGKGGTTYNMTKNLVMKFSKKTKILDTLLNSLRDAVPCGLLAIRQDSNGACWLLGWNDVDKGGRPFTQLTDNFDSGTKPDDEGANAVTVTLTCMSGYDELPFNSTLTAAIVGGTSTFVDFS